MTQPTVISLFCGCGGIDAGLHAAGYKTVWSNDSDKYACLTFRRNLGDVCKCADVRTINPDDPTIPPADLVCGGFPCQSFSTINRKRKGTGDARGRLFQTLCSFIEQKKPKAFIAENVRGLLSVDKSRETFQRILTAFDNISPEYYVKPYLIRMEGYGIPQKRTRLIFVGTRVDTGFVFKMPRKTHGAGLLPYMTTGAALSNLPENDPNNQLPKNYKKRRDIIKLIPEGGGEEDLPIGHPARRDKPFHRCMRRLDRKKPSLTVLSTHGSMLYHFQEPRPLTVREYARLQTFPDDFIFEGSYYQAVVQIGNAVPPKFAEIIGRALFTLFSGQYDKEDAAGARERVMKLDAMRRLKAGDALDIKI